MAENILYPHLKSDIPPIGKDEFSQIFDVSDNFFAEIIFEDDDIPKKRLVYYSYRTRSWIDCQEGEEVNVATWWSKEEEEVING